MTEILLKIALILDSLDQRGACREDIEELRAMIEENEESSRKEAR